MKTIRKNEPIKNHTSIRIGGNAGLFFIPDSEEEVAALFDENNNALLLGGGTNMLVSDEGVPVVISMKGMCEFESTQLEDGAVEVTVGSGYGFTALARKVSRLGLKGMEFAFGIPGTVGGAVVMNAGANGKEVKDVLSRVRLLVNNRYETVDAKDLSLSYRESSLPKGAVIIAASFVLERGIEKEIKETMMALYEKRKNSQPLNYPSAGSIFKNPPGEYAGKIIEELGFKGEKVGDAMVSEKHANFIINLGNATAAQVMELIRKVETTVKEKRGISLQREIITAGNI
ncbi:MAG: UDP-N-acetylmuramate dehydrogenase [Nitrospinota bacterium]|nr:UDP-N-acetylmuramate dehydrogenase [Nitrospinota bacterium]